MKQEANLGFDPWGDIAQEEFEQGGKLGPKMWVPKELTWG